MNDDIIFLIFISFLSGLLFSGLFIATAEIYKSNELREQAIEHNCAEYDAKTGEWQWKSHVEITPDITAQYDNQFLEANCPSYSACVNQGGSPAHLKDLGDCSISCAMTLADGSLYFWFDQK